MAYRILVSAEAQKQFAKLPKTLQPKVVALIDSLAETPVPHHAKKMVGYDACYRIRFSDWRVVYEVMSETLVIDIIRIGHRSGVYKKPL